MLTVINLLLIGLCALESYIGVEITIFGFTPKVMAGSSISWESSVPFKRIRLFLRVNNEGLCDCTKLRGIVFLITSFLGFLE